LIHENLGRESLGAQEKESSGRAGARRKENQELILKETIIRGERQVFLSELFMA